MSDFLASMATLSRARADALLRGSTIAQLRQSALASQPPVPIKLDNARATLIAEVKLASPSEGRISNIADGQAEAFVVQQATKYALAGASAVSVLTEPSAFAGDLTHARAAAAALRPHAVPVMRKDFLVDPAQVYEARIAGCSGVLLIVRMLSDDALATMLLAAIECGLFALIEAFDEADLNRTRHLLSQPAINAALSSTAGTAQVLVGLNTRNLATLGVNPASLAAMIPHFPPGFPRIAESGMHTPDDVAAALRLGYTGALIGTALMRSKDPTSLLYNISAASRQVLNTSPQSNPMHRTRIKICGITSIDAARSAIDAGADALGFVLVPSPRRVTPAFVDEAARHIPAFVSQVLVARDEPLSTFPSLATTHRFYQCDAATALAAQSPELDHRTIPVLRQGKPDFDALLAACSARFQTVLIEGPRSGAGETIDWHAVAPIARRCRIILAGGLTPANVADAIRIVRPYAVDVSSGVESSPGVKDPQKIQDFINAVRAADASGRHASNYNYSNKAHDGKTLP